MPCNLSPCRYRGRMPVITGLCFGSSAMNDVKRAKFEMREKERKTWVLKMSSRKMEWNQLTRKKKDKINEYARHANGGRRPLDAVNEEKLRLPPCD